jgi:hypothetical protein
MMHADAYEWNAWICIDLFKFWECSEHEGYNLVLWKPFFHKSPLIDEYQKR